MTNAHGMTHPFNPRSCRDVLFGVGVAIAIVSFPARLAAITAPLPSRSRLFFAIVIGLLVCPPDPQSSLPLPSMQGGAFPQKR